jgi:hypothetical protein
VVVGSATVKPGEIGIIKVSVVMHQGMDGPHLFHIFIKSSDPKQRVTILKAKADIVPLETWRMAQPQAFYLPRDVAHFPLRLEIVGIDAMAYAYRAFGKHGQIRNAYLGKYAKDKQQVHLLVSEYPNAEKAASVFSEVIASMQTNSQVSRRYSRMEVEGKPVHTLKHEVHESFYFQSDNKLALLFPYGPVAEQSLKEVINYLQQIGVVR